MKTNLLLTICTLLFVATTQGQEKLWTQQTKISDVIAFEKQINPNAEFLSKNVSLSKNYYPLADKYLVTNPVIVHRKEHVYLPLYAEYFFTPGDSVLRLISYDWEKDRYGNFFDKQKMWKEEGEKLDIYNKEYERIKYSMIAQLGNPTTTDIRPKKQRGDRGKYYTRTSVWENDVFYAKLNMIFESMTYRIRMTIYWKK